MPAKLKRLRPGQLDRLVLDYMKGHRKEGPLTANFYRQGLGGRSAVPSPIAFRAGPKTARSARPNELLAPTPSIRARRGDRAGSTGEATGPQGRSSPCRPRSRSSCVLGWKG